MYARLVHFDGPRSAELVAAAERAGRERITPAVLADEQCRADHVATYVLRRPDGGELVLLLGETPETFDRAAGIITTTELLPGEDAALLPGPDRVEDLTVVHAVEHGRVVVP